MHLVTKMSMALLAVMCLAMSGVALAPAQAVARPGAPYMRPIAPIPSRAMTLYGLYAANFNAASITEYTLHASGDALPVRMIHGPHTGLGNVRDVAVDPSGYIYGVNLSGPDNINVFAPGANGDATPVRQIGGLKTMLSDPLAIALDAQGYLYVANQTEGGPPDASILVFPPGASGNVAPVRQIFGAGEAIKLAVDGGGNLIVASGFLFSSTTPNQILVYAPGANGNATPIRHISGPNTGLGAGTTALSYWSVAVLPGGARIRAALPGPVPHVNIYADGAYGDATPEFTLSGPLTHLLGTDALAIDPDSREYVASAQSNTICVYPSNASGNVPPAAIISGPDTGLNDPLGLAIGPR
jgi:hypothetical protein